MKTIKQILEETGLDINEGVYDKNIFKVIFLAGGPGSGKSFVAGKTTGGLGLKVVNSDDALEHAMKKAGLSLRMPADEEEAREAIRDRAKVTTSTKLDLYINGRLGLIIDGTGRDYGAISKQRKSFEELGYDTYMIFVNTSLETAKERNENRPRVVPLNILTNSWNQVQKNIGKFQNLFGKDKYIVVDNNKANEDVFAKVSKQMRGLVNKPVENHIAKKWIEMEKAAKKR